jgi:hypothetical protein
MRTATVSAVENGQNVELFTVISILTALGKGLQIVDRHITLDVLAAAELFEEWPSPIVTDTSVRRILDFQTVPG